MSRKNTTDVRKDPIKDWNMDQETKDFLLDNGVSVYHSGGGCVHLYYKGWIINPNESVEGIDDLYALDQVRLNREVVFSQVWNDMGGDETHFFNDLENGFKFINQYQIFGDQFANDKEESTENSLKWKSWGDLMELQGGEMELDEAENSQNYFLCMWENSWLVCSEKQLVKLFPHDIHEVDLRWAMYDTLRGTVTMIDTFNDAVEFIKTGLERQYLGQCDNMQFSLIREKFDQ